MVSRPWLGSGFYTSNGVLTKRAISLLIEELLQARERRMASSTTAAGNAVREP